MHSAPRTRAALRKSVTDEDLSTVRQGERQVATGVRNPRDESPRGAQAGHREVDARALRQANQIGTAGNPAAARARNLAAREVAHHVFQFQHPDRLEQVTVDPCVRAPLSDKELDKLTKAITKLIG
jgi:hypothetical protein